MLFYVMIENGSRIRFSPVPEVDKLFSGEESAKVKYLNAGLPLENFERYLQGLENDLPENLLEKTAEETERAIWKKIYQGLKKDSCENAIQTVEEIQWEYLPECKEDKDWYELRDERLFARFSRLVEGRLIAEGEFPLLGQELNIDTKCVVNLMHKAVLRDRGKWLSAVKEQKKTRVCQRCGSNQHQEWPSLYGTAFTCQGCKSIGALSSLQVLFQYQDKEQDLLPSSQRSGQFSFDFTPAQSQAAAELQEWCHINKGKEILVWAACGAGKTEICFPLIKDFLEKGKRVLFAAPRQDVVHDVYPRIQENFGENRVKLLSGALPPDLAPAPVTVATTHQVLRFRRAFQLIIFDEMDAYPFTDNKVLEYGIRQALGENGRMVYLTATPSEEILQKAGRKECSIIRLPARYHGYPLPVPEIIKIRLPAISTGNNPESGKLCNNFNISELRKVLKELAMEGPLLLFVPVIEIVKDWIKIAGQLFPDKAVEGSWSSDPERRKKVAAFQAGQYDIFVSTSILERGITINGVQVAVLYGDHDLFDVRALVQMAGRTGRTVQCPTGRAIFFAARKTKDMATAIDWIQEQNALAYREGYLHE